jgi:hypothetical protein
MKRLILAAVLALATTPATAYDMIVKGTCRPMGVEAEGKFIPYEAVPSIKPYPPFPFRYEAEKGGARGVFYVFDDDVAFAVDTVANHGTTALVGRRFEKDEAMIFVITYDKSQKAWFFSFGGANKITKKATPLMQGKCDLK